MAPKFIRDILAVAWGLALLGPKGVAKAILSLSGLTPCSLLALMGPGWSP